MRLTGNKSGRRALALLPLWLLVLTLLGFTTSFVERSQPAGSYDAADTVEIYFPVRGQQQKRQLTKEEYDAIKAFLRHAEVRSFTTRTSDGDAGAITIDGQQWTMYRDSLYLNHWDRRLVINGVSFTDPKGFFADLAQMIEWAKDR